MSPAKKTVRPQPRRRKAPPYLRALKWVAALGVAALVVYGVSQLSGVPYNERALGMVDFSALTASAKRVALKAANGAECGCGCGMTLAQCVATDSTCPRRETNIDRIRTMVREAESH